MVTTLQDIQERLVLLNLNEKELEYAYSLLNLAYILGGYDEAKQNFDSQVATQ